MRLVSASNDCVLPISPLEGLPKLEELQKPLNKLELQHILRELENLLRKSGTIIDDFIEQNKKEIKFVTTYFNEHPHETQLHAHHKGKQIIYQFDQKEITLQHTYFYWNNTLYTKVVRKHIAGIGSFNHIKYLLDVNAKQWVIMRTPSNPDEKNIHPKENQSSLISRLDKKSNPMKGEHAKTKTIELQRFLGLDLFFIYNIMKQSRHNYSALLQLPYLMVLVVEKFHRGEYFKQGKKMIHGDIKPENFTLQFVDGKPHISLIDYDFSIFQNDQGTYTAVVLAGSPDYLAPELRRFYPVKKSTDYPINFIPEELSLKKDWRGNSICYLYTQQADIYALGISIEKLMPDICKKYNYSDYSQQILKINGLMQFAHPHARPSLHVLKYVFFFLYWHHVMLRNADFSNALSTENIAPAELEKIQLITWIYLQLSNLIRKESAHDWKIAQFINSTVESDATSIIQLKMIETILEKCIEAKNKPSERSARITELKSDFFANPTMQKCEETAKEINNLP